MDFDQLDLEQLSRSELASLLARTKSLEGLILAKLLSGPDVTPDRTLTIDELIAATGMSRRTLFAKSKKLPFITRTGRKSLVGSSAGLTRWLANRRRG
jgi:predicted DNA-binding transcriptional regulator AlpA